jgi:hypothetical protein
MSELSTVLDDSVVEDRPSRLEVSLPGRRVRVVRGDGSARTLKLPVGDRPEAGMVR